MTACGSTVIGTVLSGMEFSDFLCARYNLTPPNLQKNVMVVPNHSPYITHLISKILDSSSHVTIKCFTSSSTSRNIPFHWTSSVTNPSSIRAVSDLTNGYITWGYKIRIGVVSYLGYSGNVILTPLLTSYLEIPTAHPTTSSQWAAFPLSDKRGERTSTVSNIKSNISTFIRFFSLLTVLLVKRPSYYSINWVNSWPRN